MSDAFPQLDGPKIDVNLYPNAASSGINAGNAQKTPLQAGVEGAIEGVKTGLQVYQGVQQIQANDQNAAIRQNTINQLPTANALENANLTEQQQQNVLRQKNIDNYDATAQAAAEEAKAKLSKDKADAQLATLKAQDAQSQSDSVSNVSDIFSLINRGGTEQGIQKLAQNLPDLFRAGLIHDGTNIVPNDAIVGQISSLTYQAQKTGDPETIATAQQIVDQFQSAIRAQTDTGKAEKTKSFSLDSATKPLVVDTPTDTRTATQQLADDAMKSSGIPGAQQIPAATGASAPNTSGGATGYGGNKEPLAAGDNFDLNKAQAIPAGNQQSTSTAPAPSSEGAFAPVPLTGKDYRFPAEEGQPNILEDIQKNPQIKEAYDKSTPLTKRISGTAVSKQLETNANEIYANSLKLDPNANDTTKASLINKAVDKATELVKISPQDQKAMEAANGYVQTGDELAQKVTSLTQRIEDFRKKSGYIVPIGASQTFAQRINNIKAQAGFSSDDADALDQVQRQLDQLGNADLITSVKQSAGSTIILRNQQEVKLLQGLHFGSSDPIEQNLSNLSILKSSVQHADAANRVRDLMIGWGRGYGEAQQASADWQRNNPTVKNTDTINGYDYPTGNNVITSPEDFVNERLGLPRIPFKMPDGRNYNAPGASNGDLLNVVHPLVTKKSDNGITTPDSNNDSSGGSTPPRAPLLTANRAGISGTIDSAYSGQDIPSIVKGRAPAALIARVIGAESNGRERAVGPVYTKHGVEYTAKGIMQLDDDTGKLWYQKLGFDGEYDPFDGKKNLLAGTAYLNSLLFQFGGDTRLALAAYNAGPYYQDKASGTRPLQQVANALEKGQTTADDVSWDYVKLHLPKETVNYVDHIMGDDKTKPEVRQTILAKLKDTFGPLAGENSTAWASENLSDEGLAHAHNTANIDSVEKVAGTQLEHPINSLLSPDGTPPTLGYQDALAQRLAKTLSPSENAFMVGAARMIFAGGDDELYGGIRAGLHGEDFDTATSNYRKYREQAYAESPWAYRAGSIAGLAGQAVLAPETLVKAAPAKVAAAYGAVSGYLEGEGGWGNRSISAGIGALFGTVLAKSIGPVIAGTAWGINKTIAGIDAVGDAAGLPGNLGNSIKSIGSNIATKAGLTNPTLRPSNTFSKAEKRVSQPLTGIPTSDLVTAEKELSGDPDLQLGDVAPATSLDATLRAAAKQPIAAGGIRTVGDARLNELESSTGLVNTALDNAGTVAMEPATAFKDAATNVQKDVNELKKVRKDEAATAYPAAKASLKNRPTKGKPFGSVRYFSSKAVNDLIEKDPIVSREISAASGTSEGGVGTQPKNSFEVVKRAFSELRKKAQAGGPDSSADGEAFTKFRKAVFTESKEFEKATSKYKAASEALEALNDDPVINKLLDAADPKTTTNIDKFGVKLFDIGATELKTVMGKLPVNTQQSIKNAVRGYITNVLDSRGTRVPGAAREFPDFTANLKDDKLRAVFGDVEGGELAASLTKARRIAKTANTALRLGSETHSTIAETQGQGTAKGAAQSIVGGLTGSIANLASGAIKTSTGLKNYILGTGPLDGPTADAVGKLILKDRPAAIQFLKKEIQARADAAGWKATKEQISQAIRRLLPGATSSATDQNFGNVTQSQSAQIKEQLKLRRKAGALQ